MKTKFRRRDWKNTVMGTSDYLKSRKKAGILFYPDVVKDDFRIERNNLSNRLNRMHKNNRFNGSIESGTLGAGIGLLGSQLTLFNLKDRLRRKYPEKSNEEINKMANKIAIRSNLIGTSLGAGIGVGLQVLSNNSRYNKARNRLSKESDYVYKYMDEVNKYIQ